MKKDTNETNVIDTSTSISKDSNTNELTVEHNNFVSPTFQKFLYLTSSANASTRITQKMFKSINASPSKKFLKIFFASANVRNTWYEEPKNMNIPVTCGLQFHLDDADYHKSLIIVAAYRNENDEIIYSIPIGKIMDGLQCFRIYVYGFSEVSVTDAQSNELNSVVINSLILHGEPFNTGGPFRNPQMQLTDTIAHIESSIYRFIQETHFPLSCVGAGYTGEGVINEFARLLLLGNFSGEPNPMYKPITNTADDDDE